MNSGVLLLQYATGSLVPLLLVPHIVRQIGLSAYGELAIALTWAAYGAVTVQYAFHLTGPQRLANLPSNGSTAGVFCEVASAKLVLLVGVVLIGALGLAAAPTFGYALSAPQAWLMLALPLAAALNAGWYLQAVGAFATTSLLAASGAVLSVLVGLLTIRGAEAITFAALALSIGALWTGVATAGAAVWRLRAGAVREPVTTNGSRLGWRAPGSALQEGRALFASQFVAALYSASGPLVIGALAGTQEAGAYSVVERATSTVVGACLLTHTAAYPQLARAYNADRPAYFRLLKVVLLSYGAAAMGVVVAVTLAWPQVLAFFLGAAGGRYGPLLVAALLWLLLAVAGTLLTGYFAVSGQGGRTLPLTARILVAATLVGVPAVLVLGAVGWMVGLCASQLLVLAEGWRAWRIERSMDK